MSTGEPLVGRTLPRVWTRPLVTGPPGPCGCGCALTPETSLGFAFLDFCEILGWEPIPWQRWLAIHAMELLPSGMPRFRTILVLIARQNGKTTFLAVLILFWLTVMQRKLVLGTSTTLEYAREAWMKAIEIANESDEIKELFPLDRHGNIAARATNGQETLATLDGCRYKIATAGRKGGRSLTVEDLVCDELREHRDFLAWGAASKAMMAVPDAQGWCISNAGDDSSVVLNSFRSKAMLAIDSAEQIERPIALFEYSAVDGCEMDDREQWAQANPSLGYTITEEAIADALLSDPPEVFRTEVLCQHVPALDAAVPADAWISCADPTGTLDAVRGRIGLCFDISLDLRHATLAAAGVLDDGRIRVEIVAAWDGRDAVAQAKRVLAGEAGLIARINPRQLGWFPSTRKAGLEQFMTKLVPQEKRRRAFSGAEVSECCGGLVTIAVGRELLHPNDDLLNAHVAGAKKIPSGDGFSFTRRGPGHVDALYAAAGAVQIARTLPRPVGKVRVITAG